MAHISPKSKQVTLLVHSKDLIRKEENELNDHYDIYVDLKNNQLRTGTAEIANTLSSEANGNIKNN